MASDGPSRDPAPACRPRSPRPPADDLDAALRRHPRRRRPSGLGAAAAAIFLQIPDRPGLQLAASTGWPTRRRSSPEVRTEPPVRRPRRRATGRSTVELTAPGRDDRGGLRAARRRERRRRDVARVARHGLAGAARQLEDDRARGRHGPRRPRRARRRSRAAGVDGLGALRVVRADGPHRSADRASPTSGPSRGSSSSSWLAPAARAARSRSRSSTSTTSVGQRDASGPRGRRRHPAPRRGGAGRVGPAGRHGRPHRRRRVRPGRAGLGRRDGRAAGPWTASPRCPRSPGGRCRCPRASPASRSTARTRRRSSRPRRRR